VKPVLPGITTEGEVTLEPPDVIVAMPSQMRQRFPQGLPGAVEAALERFDLEQLEPGVSHTREVKLRLPAELGVINDVTLTPSRVKVSFTVRSRIRDTRLQNVRVQIAGPADDQDLYVVEIDPDQLQNVTVSADADLIRRIEANEVPVVAVLHLSPLEMQSKIASKRISYFVALVPQPDGTVRGEQVNAKVDHATEPPAVNLTISERGE
jgi:hypothetical protein